jgi:hypothetical protein
VLYELQNNKYFHFISFDEVKSVDWNKKMNAVKSDTVLSKMLTLLKTRANAAEMQNIITAKMMYKRQTYDF